MQQIILVATSSRSSAEDLGYLFGGLIGIATVLGVLVFALVAVIKAFTRSTRGWIIAGSIGGVILAALVLLVLAGIISGVMSPSKSTTRTSSAGSNSQALATTSPPAATSATSATKFSSQTEAAAALLRKFGLNPSEEFVFAFHNVENTAGQFVTATGMIDTDAIMDPTRKADPILEALQTFRTTADDLLAAVRRYKEQVRRELSDANLTSQQREQILKQSQHGYDHIEAAATAGITAAEAGIELRHAFATGASADAAQQRFVESWNAYSRAMNTLVTSAQKTQQQADDLNRSKP